MSQENSNESSSDHWCETKCIKCKQEFSETEPKLLPCLHTLCNSCVSSESTISVIVCPLCRQDCKIDDLIVNQFIKESTSQNENQKTEQKSSSCTNCDDDAATTSFCTDCSEWLCEACVQAHLRVRITKDHTIQSKEEVMGDQSSNVPQKLVFCPTHKQEPLKVFCESCDVLTCRDCQLTEHREHRYQFVSEASHHHKLYLQTLLEKLREKKTYMEAAKTLIGKRYKDIAEREQVVTNEIKMFAIRFITEINRRGKQLLAELHEVCGQKKAALGLKNTELTAMSAKLDHCLNFVESAISRSSDVALLYSKRTITNQLRNVLRSHCEVPNPNHIVDIRFVYENAFLSNYINQLGCLMVDNMPYHVRTGSYSSPHISSQAMSSNNNNNAAPATRALKGISFVNKEMMLNMFGNVPNSNQPHVSSSTHPADAQRNIRLRSLLEQAPAIPPQAMRSAGPFVPPSGIPKNQPSPIIQNNSALCRMLVNNHTVGRSGNLWHNPIQKSSVHGIPSSSGSPMNINAGKLQSLSYNRGIPSHHAPSNSMLSLSNTQRLSHYPALCASAPAFGSSNAPASISIIGPEMRMTSPQSSQSSPGLNASSSAIPIQITNVISQKPQILATWNNHNSKNDAPSSQESSGNPQERSIQSTVSIKQEVAPSNFPSCSISRVNIKQEIVDDAQEIAETARCAMRFFCDDSMGNIMGSLKSLPGEEAQHDSSNEVELIEGQNVINNMSSSNAKAAETNQDSEKPEKNSVQQADSSCSPGLLLVDCHTNDSSLDTAIINSKAVSPDNNASFNCNTSLDHDINTQLNCKVTTCHESQNQDPNDDWCAVCHDGGNLLCCGFCPRVYHLGCHIPTLNEFPGPEDQWQCLLCRNFEDIHKYIVKDTPPNIKRKNPVGLSGHDLRVCERILLELFCHELSSSFHHPVSRAEAPDYHKIITAPMDLSTIKKKLSPCHFNHYDDVQEFLEDFKLMFKNCYTYNEVDSIVYNAGKKLEDCFNDKINQHFPSILSSSTPNDSESEPEAKKQKTDCVVIW